MVSLSTSSSRASSIRSSPHHVPSNSVASVENGSSASSSSLSLNIADEENVTITANRSLQTRKGKEKSIDDLHLLAVSTRMTELSYSISDIQTRIFEIQELRHKSQSSGDAAGTTSIIDQSLMNLDERLESVAQGMKNVSDLLEPLLQASSTPTASQSESVLILRKHATLAADWEAVQDESDVLREELKEDKWLTVFRTVTEQADGMMSSLEKAVNRCQDFIWKVRRNGPDDHSISTSPSRERRTPLTLEMFNSLLDSFEAKKKHYMPATSKVLSVIDKGVQDRVTKNGETLRRHAESAQRWRNLRERIFRTDAEMESVRKIFLGIEMTPSEHGSSTSGTTSVSKTTKNGYLATPPSNSKHRAPSAATTLSRSISPFRRLAKRFTGGSKSPAPATPGTFSISRTPSSEPVPTLRRQRTTIFSFRGSHPPTPITPDRPGHKYSQSLTPESSPKKIEHATSSTVKSRMPPKQPWNSSTKVEPEERNTIKASTPRRPSAAGFYGRPEDIPPVPTNGSPYRRSMSRSSMASSRPWSPVTSSISTATSSNPSAPIPFARPPSRSHTPGMGTTPRARPKTPSHIPAPAKTHWAGGSDISWDDDDNPTTLMQRAFSPTFSISADSNVSSQAHGNSYIPPPRPPSRSMIPVPSLQFQSASRPGTAMSQYRSESPALSSFKGMSSRAQTPETTLRAKAQEVPFYQPARTRPALHKLPPSSFKDASSSRTPSSRPSSRAGASTPGFDQAIYQYVPTNPKDPLDTEVAVIVNSIAHGLLIERVDPPLKVIPKEGEEIRAQYAFSTSLSRKVVTCRLTTMTRSGAKYDTATTTKKVMCRVGGGWQDLHLYMLNRQAGL